MSKWNGNDYNKKDFHYARTSQEAFGQRLTKADFETLDNDTWDKVVFVACIVTGIILYVGFGFLEWAK